MNYAHLSKEELLIRLRKAQKEINKLKDAADISHKAIYSDEIYHILFEASNDAIILMNEDMFIECNGKAVKMFGCPDKSVLINNPPFKFSPDLQPDGRNSEEKAKELIKTALSGEPQYFRWLHSRYDGTPFLTEIYLHKIGYISLPHLIVIINDISDREAAVSAQRESKELFNTIVKNMVEGAILLDFTGKLIFINPAGLKIIDQNEEKNVIGFSITDFINNKAQKKIKGILKKLSKGKSDHFGEISFDNQNWYDSLATKIKYQGEWICLLTLRPLSAEGEGRLALQQSEERYRTLFELSPSGILLEDSNGKILDINPAYCNSFGYHKEQLIGRYIHDFAEESKEKVDENIKRILSGERLTHVVKNSIKNHSTIYMELIENRITLPDGQTGILSVSNNITERINTLNILKESEENYRLLAETIKDFIVVIKPDQKISYVNQAFLKSMGFSDREVIGKKTYVITHPKYHNKLNMMKEQRFDGNREHISFELELLDRHGHTIPVEGISSPIIKNGEFKGIMVIARDITLRKKLESQLIQTQKMDAIGRLAGGIAHDFNNIMTIIMGYSKQIYNQVDEDSPVIKDLIKIEKAGIRARKLTQQLLNFSRKQVLQPRLININDFIKNMDTIISQLLGSEIKLELQLKAIPETLQADPLQLEQSILNIIFHSKEFLIDKGELSINTKNIKVETPLKTHFGLIPSGFYILLEISDNGPQIQADILKDIFEPFFTIKKDTTDSGLGLASVYGFVKQSNGFIDVSSKNDGTTFHLYFPVNKKTPHIKTNKNTPKKQQDKTTILVAEDETDLKNLICEILTQNYYDVICAADGEEALQAVYKHQNEISIILSDIIMPRMSGPEFIDKLLESGYNPPAILFMSGYSDDRTSYDKWEDRRIEFIQKPFTPNELINRIKALLT
jgi:PAS domain S-box-containing protein